MRRRQLLIAAGSASTTALAFTLTSNSAKADQLSVDGLEIPNADYDATKPINKARLRVNGRYQWETSVVPDKAILRLELQYAGSWEQLEATKIPGQLDKTQEDSYSLEGNLFDHSQIDPIDLSPQTVGESKSLDFSVRVKLGVKNDGRTLKTLTAEDTASITVNKTTAEVTGTIGGEGSFEFGEV